MQSGQRASGGKAHSHDLVQVDGIVSKKGAILGEAPYGVGPMLQELLAGVVQSVITHDCLSQFFVENVQRRRDVGDRYGWIGREHKLHERSTFRKYEESKTPCKVQGVNVEIISTYWEIKLFSCSSCWCWIKTQASS